MKVNVGGGVIRSYANASSSELVRFIRSPGCSELSEALTNNIIIPSMQEAGTGTQL